MIGIYSITNKINDNKYYGSSKNIDRRLKAHKNELRRGIHRNPRVQNSWNKYRENSFEFKIELEVFKPFIHWIENIYLPFGYFNISKDATKGGMGMLGRHPTAETREKMSIAKKGKIRIQKPEEIAKRIGNQWRRGYKHSEETKRMMSLTRKGKKSNGEGKLVLVDQSNFKKNMEVI